VVAVGNGYRIDVAGRGTLHAGLEAIADAVAEAREQGTSVITPRG
jgi:hypothetical protein